MRHITYNDYLSEKIESSLIGKTVITKTDSKEGTIMFVNNNGEYIVDFNTDGKFAFKLDEFTIKD